VSQEPGVKMTINVGQHVNRIDVFHVERYPGTCW